MADQDSTLTAPPDPTKHKLLAFTLFLIFMLGFFWGLTMERVNRKQSLGIFWIWASVFIGIMWLLNEHWFAGFAVLVTSPFVAVELWEAGKAEEKGHEKSSQLRTCNSADDRYWEAESEGEDSIIETRSSDDMVISSS